MKTIEENKRNEETNNEPVTERKNYRPGPKRRYVPLPAAPKTKSPVPWLTSLHGVEGHGGYGDPKFRGNCSGLLIKDLLSYYQPKRVLDVMAGSGTCRDVCGELGIACESQDLTAGFDATEEIDYLGYGKQAFDFAWIHPPYWRLVNYNEDPRCLSNSQSLTEFLDRLRAVIQNVLSVLTPEGRFALLMGDYRDRGEYLALPFRTFNVAVSEGLTLDAPEIVRFDHGSNSSYASYNFSLIPRLHSLCFVFRRTPSKAANGGNVRGGAR